MWPSSAYWPIHPFPGMDCPGPVRDSPDSSLCNNGWKPGSGPPASENTFPHSMVTWNCISKPLESLNKSGGSLDVMAMYQQNYFIISGNNRSEGFGNGVCKYVLRMPRTNPESDRIILRIWARHLCREMALSMTWPFLGSYGVLFRVYKEGVSKRIIMIEKLEHSRIDMSCV